MFRLPRDRNHRRAKVEIACVRQAWNAGSSFIQVHVLGEVRFYLPARKGQKARAVVQQVSTGRCTLQVPNGQPIEVTAVLAQETGAPDGVKPIQWCLLTNRAATTLEQSAELIDWYRCRW